MLRPQRGCAMGEIEGNLGVDPVFAEKPAEGLDAQREAVLRHPVVVQVAAPEVALQRRG